MSAHTKQNKAGISEGKILGFKGYTKAKLVYRSIEKLHSRKCKDLENAPPTKAS